MICYRNRNFVAAILTVVILLLAIHSTTSYAKSYYSFDKVIHGPLESVNYNGTPLRFDANIQGGLIVVKMPDTSGSCSGVYRFTWNFNGDISTIEAGKEYLVSAKGERIKGGCLKNSTKMYLRPSMSGSVLADKNGLSNRDKMIRIVVKQSSSITAYPPTALTSFNAKIKTRNSSLSKHPGYDYFTFLFSFSSYPYNNKSKMYKYEVVYLYKK